MRVDKCHGYVASVRYSEGLALIVFRGECLEDEIFALRVGMKFLLRELEEHQVDRVMCLHESDPLVTRDHSIGEIFRFMDARRPTLH